VGTGQVTIDTVGPAITALTPDGSVINQFSPNGDGSIDTIATTATAQESGSLVVRVLDSGTVAVRTFTTTAVAGPNTVTWDGRNDAGTVVPDGEYAITIAGRDVAGNTGASRSRTVRVVTLLGFTAASPSLIYPQDLDRFAPSAALSFKLSRPAHVTWTLRNAAGAIVLTHLDADVAAGTQTWTFTGRMPDGTMLPVGVYTSYVYADDGSFVYAQSAKVEMNAFSVAPSTTSPKRGTSMTVTATTAEPLTGVSQLYVTQPGVATYILKMTATSSKAYRITFTPKTSGTTGTMTLKVWGKDADGRTQATILRLTLH
jgi:flagellar hook assembly protein FlgD